MPTTPKPARRWKRIALVSVAALVCSVLTFLAIRPFNGIWDVQLEAEFNRDLPYGATDEEARAWFASRGFYASKILKIPNTTGNLVECGIATPVPNDTLFESAEINISVIFDADGRVCEKHFRRWVRCL
jgi:hypothetical protein